MKKFRFKTFLNIAAWTLFGLLIVQTCNAQIDTESIFKDDRIIYKESNDCTVRAYAVLTGKTYTQARAIVNDTLGRKRGKGIDGIVFAKYVINTEVNRLVTAYNYKEMRGRTAPQQAFIETRCKAGNIYLVFTYQHVFVIKEVDGKWLSFGNKDDNKRDIIAYVELKQ